MQQLIELVVKIAVVAVVCVLTATVWVMTAATVGLPQFVVYVGSIAVVGATLAIFLRKKPKAAAPPPRKGK
jgi:hypothetical protein